MAHNKKHIKNTTAKYLLAGVLSFGAIGISTPAMAQSTPQAPPPPPPPGEVLSKAGEGLKKINPFGGPPPPPNPLDLFKKKKKGSSTFTATTKATWRIILSRSVAKNCSLER